MNLESEDTSVPHKEAETIAASLQKRPQEPGASWDNALGGDNQTSLFSMSPSPLSNK